MDNNSDSSDDEFLDDFAVGDRDAPTIDDILNEVSATYWSLFLWIAGPFDS